MAKFLFIDKGSCETPDFESESFDKKSDRDLCETPEFITATS